MEQVWPQAFVVDPQFSAETQGFIDSAEVVGLSPMKVSYVIDPKASWSDGYPITAADLDTTGGNSSATRRAGSSRCAGGLPRHQVDRGQQRRQDGDGRVQQTVFGLGGLFANLIRLTSQSERDGRPHLPDTTPRR